MKRRCIGAAIALTLILLGRAPAADEPSAEPAVERYAKVVAAEPDLAAWWRFEGDVKATRGPADGKAMGGEPAFAPGPGGGKALVLESGRYVTMGPTPELDLKETTVELWFKPTFQAPVAYNPCIIAKRADGENRQTRFSVHIWGDYSCLALWNGRQVMKFFVGDGPLARGRWYHVAVTATAAGSRMYVDGVPCALEGPQGTFNFAEAGRPLSLGSSQPKGVELLDCMVDEAAIYGKALSAEQIAAHVDAMGFRDRRIKLAAARDQRIQEQNARQAALEAEREMLRQRILSNPGLTAPGETFVYRGEHLDAVSLPLGGIGTGCIQINGRAERHVWQIFNNHHYAFVPDSFFAVRVKPGDGEPTVRALQTTPVGPFAPMKSLEFRGEYPFGWYAFADPGLGLKVHMETFNPLIPLQTRESSIPCAIFNLTAENVADKPVEVSFLAAQQNAVGYLGDAPIKGRSCAGYGGNQNAVVRDPKATILHLTSAKPAGSPGAGDMVLMALAEDAAGTASWESLDRLHGQFAAAGTVAGDAKAGPSPEGSTLDGAMSVSFTLRPGEKRTVPLVLAWYFPNGRHGGGAWGGAGNMYANWWPDALAVARDVAANLDDLSEKTRLYHDAVYDSNLPHWLLDRITSQVAILRSQTCFWTKDDYFGGWEGCCPETGCCHGNCNHVWHYAQAHARLFPEIARRMREQEFRFQEPDGAIPHRQPKSFPAFDGQCGAVLNSYREHLMSADGKWLAANWPNIKRAMDFLITRWNVDEDGVPTGAQWNTLDGALGGTSSWLGSLYLAALEAAEKMALLEDDRESAQRYARIRASGSKKQDQALFNGDYYIQVLGPEPHEDYGEGCAIDQVLGQWWALQVALDPVYPPEHVETALKSLFANNFRGKLEGLPQRPRKFVADYDPGMQMIVWPPGAQRPPKQIRYADEVMTGFEYSAAAAMVQAGLLREGLAVARAIWTRYDGRLRTDLTASRTASWGYSGNPFGDDECGKFYARAMSVWSMLLACQGFIYDGPAGQIGFKPVWQLEDHASFFTAAEGWGVFSQKRQTAAQTETIDLRYGKLRVGSLVFELPERAEAKQVEVRLGEKVLPSDFSMSGRETLVRLKEPVFIESGQTLQVLIGL